MGDKLTPRRRTWRHDTRECQEDRATGRRPRLRERIYALGFVIGLTVGVWEVSSVEGFVVIRMIIAVVAILTAALMVLEGDP